MFWKTEHSSFSIQAFEVTVGEYEEFENVKNVTKPEHVFQESFSIKHHEDIERKEVFTVSPISENPIVHKRSFGEEKYTNIGTLNKPSNDEYKHPFVVSKGKMFYVSICDDDSAAENREHFYCYQIKDTVSGEDRIIYKEHSDSNLDQKVEIFQNKFFFGTQNALYSVDIDTEKIVQVFNTTNSAISDITNFNGYLFFATGWYFQYDGETIIKQEFPVNGWENTISRDESVIYVDGGNPLKIFDVKTMNEETVMKLSEQGYTTSWQIGEDYNNNFVIGASKIGKFAHQKRDCIEFFSYNKEIKKVNYLGKVELPNIQENVTKTKDVTACGGYVFGKVFNDEDSRNIFLFVANGKNEKAEIIEQICDKQSTSCYSYGDILCINNYLYYQNHIKNEIFVIEI